MIPFEKAIIGGLRTTIEDYILLKGLDFENEWSKPEYLATVNIAKSLSMFNKYPAEKIRLCIEENTEDFSNKCVPEELNDIFNRKFNDFNTQRNGNIDIAIYNSLGKSALCAIEVKNFNPTLINKNKLILDLRRNAEYFNFENEYNRSIIQKAYITYFRHFKETRFKDEIQSDISRSKAELEQIINSSVDIKNINVKIEAETVYNNLLYDGKYSLEEMMNDPGDFYGKAVHFIGVLGVFTKKTIL